MNIFSQQFETEYRKQEIEANKQSLKAFVWFFAALSLVWFLTMIDFFIIDKVTISITLAITLVLFLPLIFIALKGDLGHPGLKYYFLMLISVTCSTLLAFLTFHATLILVVPLIFSLQYSNQKTLWFTFGFSTFTHLISSYAGFYFGLCDLNVLVKGTGTYCSYLPLISEDLSITFFVEPDPAFVVGVFEFLPRTIILFVFTIMLRYTVLNHRKNAARIAELTYRKDTDIRTQLFNKTKYEEMANEYYPDIPKISVAFWDLNNLKKVNDHYGHAMGDILIETLSAKLHAYATERCNVFRIGGDEFLMILDNPDKNELEQIVKNIREDLAATHEQTGFFVSCAVGLASGNGIDIRTIVNNADANMYIDKKQMKQSMK